MVTSFPALRQSARQRVAVLGSTGSIGVNTLDVIERQSSLFEIVLLTAHTRLDTVLEQARKFGARYVGMTEPSAAEKLAATIREDRSIAGANQGQSNDPHCLSDFDAICDFIASDEVDTVVAGIVGAAGLKPVLAAVQSGKRVLIANKEPMVMLGDEIVEAARRSGAVLLPLDSEHNAIFQCLPDADNHHDRFQDVRKITLTASGGPFRTTPIADLAAVTPDMACAHPNWEMGRKISVDSATMMNKGLEIIEACRLFGITQDMVDVVVHPQSVIHSWVEYVDGSILAQMANPDMRVPIAHALGWPGRFESGVNAPSLTDIARLDFEPPDLDRFPSLLLARETIRQGGTAPAILNAANEIAVDRFLKGGIRFNDIVAISKYVLENQTIQEHLDLGTVLEADKEAREIAWRWQA